MILQTRPRARPSGQAGQAAFESVLVLALVCLAVVAMPDNAVERLMLAVEGRHQAILRHAGTP
jgi:hypothetical protein